MPELTVELYGHTVGRLVGDDWRRFDFETDRAAFEHFELGSTMLSNSVPFELRANRARATRRRNFFAELLPEGDILANLAALVRVPEFDVPKLLRAYGRDVAGAVQIYDPLDPGEPRVPFITALSDDGIASLLNNAVAQPLGNSPLTGKTSLNGVQPKLVLARVNGGWNQVHDGYPSTHIVKPVVAQHPTMIFDEEYGSRIVRRLGLLDYETWIEEFAGTSALVIERYDRAPHAPTGRVHQEDMCQALGIPRTQKYQEHGGLATLERFDGVFAATGDLASRQKLARMVIAAVATGNVDMHAKNISMLHPYDADATIAPAYDFVPMMHLPHDGRMALAVNGVYAHDAIMGSDLEQQLNRQSPALTALVQLTLEHIEQIVTDEMPHENAHPELQADILRFTRKLLTTR